MIRTIPSSQEQPPAKRSRPPVSPKRHLSNIDFLHRVSHLSSAQGSLASIHTQATSALVYQDRPFTMHLMTLELKIKLSKFKPLTLRATTTIPESMADLVESVICFEIPELPEGITKFTRLTTLKIFKMSSAALPDLLSGCTTLTDLQIIDHKLTRLPTISRLTHLTQLVVQNSPLQEFPLGLTRCTLLRHLDLSNNHLTALPPGFLSLKNLTQLNLSNNSLKAWPSVWECTALAELTLSRNLFNKIPPTIRWLPSLRNLVLSGLGMHEIPPQISSLTRLETLDLSKNNLKTLPPELTLLSQLKGLNITSNPHIAFLKREATSK